MSVSAGSVEIDFRVNDQTSESISAIGTNMQSLRQDINSQNDLVDANAQSWQSQAKQVNLAYREQRFIRREFMLSHQPFYQTTALLSSIGQAGMRMNSMFLQYNAIGIHQAQVDQRVADAKQKLADAVEKYGANSKQATAAQKDLNSAMQGQQQFNMTLPGQYAAMGMSALGFAGDIGRVALNLKLWKSDMGRAGGVGNILSGIFGVGSNAASGGMIGGMGPMRNMMGTNGKMGGLMGKFGNIGTGRMIAGGAGIALMGAGLTMGGSDDPNQRLGSLFSSSAGGAMMGTMMLPGIGTAIGGALGAVVGLAQNYHEEFANMFSGKGFLSNKDAGVNVNITVSADEGTDVTEVSTIPYVIAGPVG